MTEKNCFYEDLIDDFEQLDHDPVIENIVREMCADRELVGLLSANDIDCLISGSAISTPDRYAVTPGK